MAAWLENPDTLREMKVIHDRFPRWSEYQVTTFALMVEMMVALNIYGGGSPVDDTADPQTLLEFSAEDEDEEDEPWRG